MFATVQAEFAEALLDPEQPLPAAVTSHTARHPHKRFAVYRNNVVVGLINALRTKFPATERIVGTEFFGAMAHLYITSHPPQSRILHAYGNNFGDFIASFEPAADVPYLADIARLEAARTCAYHAADAEPLSPEDFAGIAPDAIAFLRLTLHPSLQVLRSRHPVVTIWAMNTGELELGPIDDFAAEDALVLRPGLEVSVRCLPPGGAAFLQALASGHSLAEASAFGAEDDTRFDLAANLAGLIGSGAVVALSVPDHLQTEGPKS